MAIIRKISDKPKVSEVEIWLNERYRKSAERAIERYRQKMLKDSKNKTIHNQDHGECNT